MNVGAVAEPVKVDVHWLMDEQIQLIGSNWFTSAQGQEMAELARAGLLDLSVLEHQRFPLEDVNRAISGLQNRNGGFSRADFAHIPGLRRAIRFNRHVEVKAAERDSENRVITPRQIAAQQRNQSAEN